MGELKTRFMRGDRYGIRVVAWHVSSLIHQYHHKIASFDGVSTEGLENPVWDDIVVAKPTAKIWWQVKRQTTPLKAAALGKMLVGAQAIQRRGGNNRFKIAFLELESVHFAGKGKGTTKTKARDLELSHLQQLCSDASQPGMQAARLVADTSVPYHGWWSELSAWLGTSDPVALLETASRIEIVRLGDETQLKLQAENWLAPFYDQPSDVHNHLIQFFTDYSDGRIEVSPQVLANSVLVNHAPRVGSPIWFELGLAANGINWDLRSIRPLREIARQAWIENSTVELTYASPPMRQDEVTSQLTRLALHCNITTSVRAAASTEWAAHAYQSCFSTLGTEQSKICSISTGTSSAGNLTPFETLVPKELADRLAGEMNDLLWAALVDAVIARVNALPIEPALRVSLLKRWESWTKILRQDTALRFEFTVRLVATQIELDQSSFEPQARAGVLIIFNAAEACVLAVAVAEALHVGGITVEPRLDGKSANLGLGGISAHLTALARALDPRTRSSESLSTHPYRALYGEPGIVMLGGVSQDAMLLRRFWEEDATVFSDSGTGTALDTVGALPLIPFSDSFKRAMEGGLLSLKKHLAEVLSPFVDEQIAKLHAAIAGVTD